MHIDPLSYVCKTVHLYSTKADAHTVLPQESSILGESGSVFGSQALRLESDLLRLTALCSWRKHGHQEKQGRQKSRTPFSACNSRDVTIGQEELLQQ
jgi:hypothetical protein